MTLLTPDAFRVRCITVAVSIGILLVGCRSHAGHSPPASLVMEGLAPAVWCVDAATALTAHADRCGLRVPSSVGAIRQRFPALEWSRPSSALFPDSAPRTIDFEVRRGSTSLWFTVLADSVGTVADGFGGTDPITTTFLTARSPLVRAHQQWEPRDTASFFARIRAIEEGLARLGARAVGCRDRVPTNHAAVANYVLGERAWSLVVRVDTIDTSDPFRLMIVLSAEPVYRKDWTTWQPGCRTPARTDFRPAIAAALAGADSPARLARRKRYLGMLCVGYRRMGARVPAGCDRLRESDLDESDREDFRRFFRRDSLTPPPAPPPIPASS